VSFWSNDQVEPSRLKAVGKGESEPVGDNSTQEGRMQNRRVVIKPVE
jgi:chemotaxis protein MotB